MASRKIILVLVSIAAFISAINGRILLDAKNEGEMHTAFFKHPFPPFGNPFGGFGGGIGPGFGHMGPGFGGPGIGFGGLGGGGFGSGSGAGGDGGSVGTGGAESLEKGGGVGTGSSAVVGGVPPADGAVSGQP